MNVFTHEVGIYVGSNLTSYIYCKKLEGLDYRTQMTSIMGLASFSEAMITIFEGPGPLHHEVEGSHINTFEKLKRIEIGIENNFK